MNKEELRDSYIAKGWEVQPVANWLKVSEVEGKAKYDVNAVSPDNVFGTAQVVEQNGIATAEGFWKDKADSFEGRLRTYLDTIEANASIFAISTKTLSARDSVAVCIAYKEDGTLSEYVVKERDNTFSFNQLV